MQFTKGMQGVIVIAMLLLLSACGSTPDKVREDKDAAINAEIDASLAAGKGLPPPGLDLTAPDEDPYLTQVVDTPAAARSQFNNARNAMRNQDWKTAEFLLQQLTAQYPKLSGPFLNLGLAYKQRDNYSGAEDAFKQAIAVNSLNLAAYNELALLLREQGRFDEAEKQYLAALKVWPKHTSSRKNLGILYDLYLGQWPQALEQFEIYQYLQNEPDRLVAGWIIDLKRRIEQGQGG